MRDREQVAEALRITLRHSASEFADRAMALGCDREEFDRALSILGLDELRVLRDLLDAAIADARYPRPMWRTLLLLSRRLVILRERHGELYIAKDPSLWASEAQKGCLDALICLSSSELAGGRRADGRLIRILLDLVSDV